MPFRSFPGVVASDGTASVLVQQDNASTEWDIFQVSVNAPMTSSKITAQLLINGFFLTRTAQASGDTATGPPNVILSRSDIMTLAFSGGNPGDRVNVAVWYNENVAGMMTGISI
jgi:hypothetical protein